MQRPAIYLDGNATTRVLPQAISAAVDAMQGNFGNPSSPHEAGMHARRLLSRTRQLCAQHLEVKESELIFTSGATESIQTAIVSALVAATRTRSPEKRLLLCAATEHTAMKSSLRHWNNLLHAELEVVELPVNHSGQLDLERLQQLIPHALLLATMAANNETGVVHDLCAIAAILDREPIRPLWIVDCVQALGKFHVDLRGLRVDYAAFSGHKIHAPKGIGLLFVRDESPYTPLIQGGGQEGGSRGGTENMPGIAALHAVMQELISPRDFATLGALTLQRDALVEALKAAFPSICFHGHPTASLPTVLNFHIPGVASQSIVEIFDAAGLHVATGSACSSNKTHGSAVLAAMGYEPNVCQNSIRLSFDRLTRREEIDDACHRIRELSSLILGSTVAPPPRWTFDDVAVCSRSRDGAFVWELVGPNARIELSSLPASRSDQEATQTWLLSCTDIGSEDWQQRCSQGPWRPLPGDPSQIGLPADSNIQALQLSQRIWLGRILADNQKPGYVLFSLGIDSALHLHGFFHDDLSHRVTECDSRVQTGAAQVPFHADFRGNVTYLTLLQSSQADAVAHNYSDLLAATRAHAGTLLVLDVRETPEHRANGLSTGFTRSDLRTRVELVPLSELAWWASCHANELCESTTLATVCRSGVRAKRAAHLLSQLHPNVAVLPDASAFYQAMASFR